MNDDKVLLLKLHPCSRGLSDEALAEIAEAAEMIRYDSGDLICRAEEPVAEPFPQTTSAGMLTSD